MSSFLLGTSGPCFVTDHVTGTVTLVPGFPIIETTPPQAAVLPSFVTDSDTIYTTALSATQSLLPALLDDIDALHTPAVGMAGAQALLPALYDDPETHFSLGVTTDQQVLLCRDTFDDAETVYPATSDNPPGHGLRKLKVKAVVNDADSIKACAIGASVKPATVVPADDVVYATGIAAAQRPALLASDDVVYPLTITLFVQPALVASDDAIPAALMLAGTCSSMRRSRMATRSMLRTPKRGLTSYPTFSATRKRPTVMRSAFKP